MPMSARLLRPRSTGFHPEAQTWRNAVIANGGTVSGSTLTAVSNFCRSIDAAGLRDRFYRLNLFAGTGLNACLVPLYRGPVRGGTTFGNTTDTNTNFVSGDYVETGSTGGLKGSTNKRLDTGFATNSLPDASSRHFSAYERVKSTGTFDSSLGGGTGAPSYSFMVLRTVNPATTYNLSTNGAEVSDSSYTSGGAHWIGQNSTLTAMQLYKNGATPATATSAANSVNSSPAIAIFCDNNNGSFGNFSNATLCGYSIGLHFTDAQAASYNTAIHTFNTTLGRNY